MRRETSGRTAAQRGWICGVGLAFLLVVSVARSEDLAPIPVRFEPGVKGSKLAPRYSPKGYRVKLAPSERDVPEGVEALEGRLLLGPEAARGEGHLLVLARGEAGKPYDLLWVDTDADGALDDEETRRAKPRVTRGNTYTSHDAVVQVNHGSVEEPVFEPYPIGLWVAVEAEAATPSFIRFSRRGFLVGEVTIDDVRHHVVLSDANNDAILGTGDWWSLLPADVEAPNDSARSRKVGDFAWADRSAFRLELEGTRGREGRLTAFDPGLTPEEDARARDPYWDDKHAARAEEPVPFRHDVEAAIEEAQERSAPHYLDFETVWCGPCKKMDQWVYTSKHVVAAAEGIVCVKVDGDERKDLKERHEVASFPTGILFGADGEELARFRGYRTGEQMVAFFAKAAKAPADVTDERKASPVVGHWESVKRSNGGISSALILHADGTYETGMVVRLDDSWTLEGDRLEVRPEAAGGEPRVATIVVEGDRLTRSVRMEGKEVTTTSERVGAADEVASTPLVGTWRSKGPFGVTYERFTADGRVALRIPMPGARRGTWEVEGGRLRMTSAAGANRDPAGRPWRVEEGLLVLTSSKGDEWRGRRVEPAGWYRLVADD